MPEHIWTVLCYKASFDQDDRRVSLLDIPEGITAAEPAEKILELEATAKSLAKQNSEALIPVTLEMVSWWLRSDPDKPEKGSARFRLFPPAGKPTEPFEYSLQLEEHAGFRQRIRIPFVPFRGFGRYWFATELRTANRWRRVARCPFSINKP